MPAATSAQASLSGFTSEPITLGGITINLLFNVAAMSAPESFRQGIEQAATLLASAITDRITVNITIDYSGTGGGAMAKPIGVHPLSYTTVRQDLIRYSGAIFGDILPATSSIQGQSSVDVYNAQEKLWGLLGANDTTTADGNAIFNTDIPLQQLTGMALHELTYVLGRTPVISMIDTKVPNVFDLFRFTSPAYGCSKAPGITLIPPLQPISPWMEASPGRPTTASLTTPATSSTEACKGRTIRSTRFLIDLPNSFSRRSTSCSWMCWASTWDPRFP